VWVVKAPSASTTVLLPASSQVSVVSVPPSFSTVIASPAL
jgi:hypothetical protein